MRKIFLALVFICLINSVSFAASETDDIYVRKDVFEVEMKRVNSKLDIILEELKGLRERVDSQSKQISALAQSVAALSERVDGNNKALSNLDEHVDKIHTFIYYLLVLFSLIFLTPFINKFWEFYRETRSHSSVSPDEIRNIVKELIEENNAKLSACS